VKPYLKLIPILLALAGAGSVAVYGADVVTPIVDAVCSRPSAPAAPPADASDAGVAP